MNPITLEDIQQNETIKTYIVRADETLIALGYTAVSYTHLDVYKRQVPANKTAKIFFIVITTFSPANQDRL